MKNLLLVVFSTIVLFSACTEATVAPNNELTGVVAEQGITTYQYGSHTLSTTDSYYALRSETVVLDAYIGETITIVFEKIDGYPVDGGPEFLDVVKVK